MFTENPTPHPAALVAAASLTLLLLSGGVGAQAAVLHDPWLARFQVGELRDPGDVALDDGAPAGLLAPLTVDPGWRRGADTFFADGQLPRHPGLTAWRLAVPALGSAMAAEQVHATARAQWHELSVPAGAGVGVNTPVREGPWTTEIHLLRASRLWEAGRWADAARAAHAIVQARRSLDLGSDAAFVWALRAWHLDRLAGQQPDDRAVWARLLDLGLYDTRSGWAVWRALRAAAERPPLPAGAADRATARMLATSGDLGLDAARFRAAGFPDQVAAGLGGLLLPRDQLAAHFGRFPAPPDDPLFQGHWLRGQRRLDSSTAHLERLAAREDLIAGHRLDLWRRASERHLIADRWAPGLQALERALVLLAGDIPRGTASRLQEWHVQALALAVHRGRTGDAARIVDLALAHGGPDARIRLEREADVLLARLGRGSGSAAARDFRGAHEAHVRTGAAQELASPPPLVLPPPEVWRHRLWALWAEWGLALLAGEGPAADADARRAGLEAVRGTDDPAQRHATACALVGRALRGEAAAAPLVLHAIERDIEHLAGGLALPAPSPLPDLRDPHPWDTPGEQRRGHALLGAALALGDDTGLIHAAVRLPQAGVDDLTRWSFWYPVPADPALRRALAEADAPADVLLAIARNESLFEPAVRSRAGALGYMQIMPFHYQDPAGPPGPGHWSHPATSIRAGGRILAGEIRRFGGDPYRAVAAYNAGSGAVQRWDRQLGGSPDRAVFWAWIGYPETRGYTLRVLRDRRIYRELLGATP